MKSAIHAGIVITSQTTLHNQYIVVNDESIESITNCLPPDIDSIVDCSNSILCPGFIDIHIHGRAGCDVMDNSYESLQSISKSLTKNGVTGWIGTTVTAPWSNIIESMKVMSSYIKSETQVDAQLLGSFMEGPYFTEKHRGSHMPEYLMPPTISQLEELLQVTKGTLKRVAIAPEIQGSKEAITYLRNNHVSTVIAHTNATYEQASEAIKLGCDCGVHLFNGMSGLHHREPGVVGAILYFDILAELIADGIHVHPSVLNLVYKIKGYSKTALITDCMRAGGLPDGEYYLGVQKVYVKDGQAKTLDGSLAGSTCSLDQALRNMVNMARVPLWEAVQMVTSVPAKYLGLDNAIGDIKPGYVANLVVLSNNLNVQKTMIKGQWRYMENANES